MKRSNHIRLHHLLLRIPKSDYSLRNRVTITRTQQQKTNLASPTTASLNAHLGLITFKRRQKPKQTKTQTNQKT